MHRLWCGQRSYDIVLPLLAATGTGPLVVEFAMRRQPAAPEPSRPGDDECDLDNQIVCAEEVDEPMMRPPTTPESAARWLAADELCDLDNQIVCADEEPPMEEQR